MAIRPVLPSLSPSALEALAESWRAMTSAPPGALDRDFVAFGDLFDPRLDAMQLLRRLELIEPSPDPPQELAAAAPPLIIRLGSRTLVTPDGRLALAGVDCAHLPAPYTDLVDAYRGWCLAPLLALAAELAGRGEPTTPAALGLLVVLLGCNAVCEANAIHVTNANLGPLRAAFRPALASLTAALATRSHGHAPDFDGYALSKARRRMGGDLRREPDRRLPASVWLASHARTRALRVVAYEVVAQRAVAADVAVSIVATCLEALTNETAALAALGVTLTDTSALLSDMAHHITACAR